MGKRIDWMAVTWTTLEDMPLLDVRICCYFSRTFNSCYVKA